MIYELDKIDAIKYDNKHTITIFIYDIDIWNTEEKKLDHKYYTQKKIEAYVNYILQGGALKYFELNEQSEIRYSIEFISQQNTASNDYIEFLSDLSKQINAIPEIQINLNYSNFKEA